MAGSDAVGEPLLPHKSFGATAAVPAWRVLTVLCGVAFTSNVIISLIAPILPQHYEVLGVSQIWCGVMFSSFPVAVLVCSPLVVKASSRVGRVPVLFFGLLLQGATSITFGYSDQLTGGPGANTSAALVVYALSRLLCGAGGACANNAIFSITADRFPDDLSKVMGLNEVVIGMGFSLGPPIGVGLVMRYGFELCFLVAGVCTLVFAPAALLLWQPPPPMKPEGNAGAQDMGLSEVLTPGLLVAGFSMMLGTGVFGIVEPLLSLYLKQEVGVGAAGIGAIFGVFAFAYSLSGPFMGALADRLGPMQVCTAGGLMAGLIMVLLLGPEARTFSPHSTERVTYEVVALVLLGLAQAATLIPSLPAMKASVTLEGNAVTDRIVAWFNIFMQLGLAIAPLVGTALNEIIRFELTMVVTGGGVAAYGAFAVAFARRHRNGASVAYKSPNKLVTGMLFSPETCQFGHRAEGDPVWEEE